MITKTELLSLCYGDDLVGLHSFQERLSLLKSFFGKYFKPVGYPLRFFSSPGRIEIMGNHTDHNNGKVIAAPISRDIMALVRKTDSPELDLYDIILNEHIQIDLTRNQPVAVEFPRSQPLLREIIRGFQKRGYRIGGLQGCLAGSVKGGSGLSSSAALELLLGIIFNAVFNNNQIAPTDLAKIGQEAELKAWSKPCGLMDQMAAASAGAVRIDFSNPTEPFCQPVKIEPDHFGYSVVIIDTGGSHSDLTEDYASIPQEMRAVARALGKDQMSEISIELLLSDLSRLRNITGDRALLRAIHFLEENRRVDLSQKALLNDDFSLFLDLVNASGHSSLEILENAWSLRNPREQGIPLAHTLSNFFFNSIGVQGALRFNGGGFAGTLLAFLPETQREHYHEFLAPVFGPGSVYPLFIRKIGACEFTEL